MALDRQKRGSSERMLVSGERLRRLMSEVISLREKVAQAELAANRYGVSQQMADEEE
jgi:hypothetical protein